MNIDNEKQKIKIDFIIRIIVVLLVVVLLMMEVRVLVRDFNLSKEYFSSGYRSASEIKVKIEPWMTFGYINNIFGIPEGYLRSYLNIEDKRYPNIQILRYAKENDIDRIFLMQNIVLAINNYEE